MNQLKKMIADANSSKLQATLENLLRYVAMSPVKAFFQKSYDLLEKAYDYSVDGNEKKAKETCKQALGVYNELKSKLEIRLEKEYQQMKKAST